MFPTEHIERAIDSVLRLNQRPAGLVDLTQADGSSYTLPDSEADLAWPALSIAHFASLCFYRAKPEAGMRILKEWVQLQQHSGRWTCHAPTVWNMGLGIPVANSPDHAADTLSLWYVIYAFQGFQLYLREGLLRIMPSLPEGVHQINMPLFTSSCLGWLQFQEDAREGYWQSLQVTFDSPTWVKELELRVPETVKAVEGTCREGEDAIEATCEIEVRDDARKVRIVFRQPRSISQNLCIKLMETSQEDMKEKSVAKWWINKK